jgi:hypothetical protein
MCVVGNEWKFELWDNMGRDLRTMSKSQLLREGRILLLIGVVLFVVGIIAMAFMSGADVEYREAIGILFAMTMFGVVLTLPAGSLMWLLGRFRKVDYTPQFKLSRFKPARFEKKLIRHIQNNSVLNVDVKNVHHEIVSDDAIHSELGEYMYSAHSANSVEQMLIIKHVIEVSFLIGEREYQYIQYFGRTKNNPVAVISHGVLISPLPVVLEYDYVWDFSEYLRADSDTPYTLYLPENLIEELDDILKVTRIDDHSSSQGYFMLHKNVDKNINESVIQLYPPDGFHFPELNYLAVGDLLDGVAAAIDKS